MPIIYGLFSPSVRKEKWRWSDRGHKIFLTLSDAMGFVEINNHGLELYKTHVEKKQIREHKIHAHREQVTYSLNGRIRSWYPVSAREMEDWRADKMEKLFVVRNFDSLSKVMANEIRLKMGKPPLP